MVTKRKSEMSKAMGETRRGLRSLLDALPMMARVNWRNLVMPWRMLPMPVAMALIALVALAMVLDNGDNVNADPLPLEGQGVVIGADTVAPGTRCAEDDVITYRVFMGGQGVGCVHYEYVVMEFIDTCLIGNSTHGDNLASLHLRDPAFRSWCDAVVDDVSDGIASLDDLLFDVGSSQVPTASPIVNVVPLSTTPTPTAILPKSLPLTGSH